jgi:hypothetical protein
MLSIRKIVLSASALFLGLSAMFLTAGVSAADNGWNGGGNTVQTIQCDNGWNGTCP